MITKETIQKILHFRNERDWEQFHNSKDLAVALSIEASELLELFLWKGNEECGKKCSVIFRCMYKRGLSQ